MHPLFETSRRCLVILDGFRVQHCTNGLLASHRKREDEIYEDVLIPCFHIIQAYLDG